MPVLFKSLEMESMSTVAMQATLADAVAVPSVGVNAFHNAQPLVDKMVNIIITLILTQYTGHFFKSYFILTKICILVIS